ncbi:MULTISPECIES: hypothetical protein [unclassified Pseudomonas]|uniref:hypothetical protein n=1 Tax=unclassified Pseudomonas TaxID=196821 RepID=UPI0010DC109F|nr:MULTISPECIES: hypothetical protein [unclassified Pseudomonas]VII91642.1 Uncharacterized conserved protein [Pseudomonas sp. FG-3G]
MSLKDDLALLIHQEETLQFLRFDEQTAWQMGSCLYERAAAESWPLVIDVRRFDRPCFSLPTPA